MADDSFLDGIKTQSELNRSINDAFDSYKAASSQGWFRALLKASEFTAANIKQGASFQGAIVSEIKKGNKEQTEATNALNDTVGDSNNELTITTPGFELSSVDKLGNMLKNLGINATAGFTDSVKAAAQLKENISFIAEEHQKFFASVKNAYGGVSELGSTSANEIGSNLTNAYDQFAKRATMSTAQLDEIGRGYLSIQGTALGEFTDSVDTDLSLLDFVYENKADAFKDYMEIVNSTSLTYGTQISSTLGKNAEDIGLIMRGLDITQQDLQKIITRTIDQTGEVSMEALMDFNKFAQSASDASGQSAKLIADNMTSIMGDVQNFGNVMPEEASRIGTALLEIGAATETLGKLVSKFSNFDQAASAVGDLTAAFGLNLDAMEMMVLANEDQEQFMFRMRDAFEEQGLEFREMSLAQQKLLASKLNLGVEEASRFFNFDNEITSIEELKEAGSAADAVDEMKQMTSEIATLLDQGGSLQSVIERNKSFGLGGAFVKDAIEANKQLTLIEGLVGKIQILAQKEINIAAKDAITAAADFSLAKMKKIQAALAETKTQATKLTVDTGPIEVKYQTAVKDGLAFGKSAATTFTEGISGTSIPLDVPTNINPGAENTAGLSTPMGQPGN